MRTNGPPPSSVWRTLGVTLVASAMVLAAIGVVAWVTQPPPRTYPVDFSGHDSSCNFPLYCSWPEFSVTLDGVTHGSNSIGMVSFSELNGTHRYTVEPRPGFQAVPGSGCLVVDGARQVVDVTFISNSSGQYGVTFLEHGLPAGAIWGMTFNRTLDYGVVRQVSCGSGITFLEHNGTYNFSVGVVQQYTPTPSSGTVDVNGTTVAMAIAYQRSSR